MVHKPMILAAVLCAVALAGCTSGSDGGSDDGGTTGTDGGAGVGGNVTVGNGTANATVSGSSSMTNTSTNASTPAPSTAEVSIEDDMFVNATVTIAVGGTVTWTHNGDNPHSVTADDDSFDSSPNCGSNNLPLLSDCLENGDDFTWTFDTPGTYTYHCKVHGSMTGTVQVVEA